MTIPLYHRRRHCFTLPFPFTTEGDRFPAQIPPSDNSLPTTEAQTDTTTTIPHLPEKPKPKHHGLPAPWFRPKTTFRKVRTPTSFSLTPKTPFSDPFWTVFRPFPFTTEGDRFFWTGDRFFCGQCGLSVVQGVTARYSLKDCHAPGSYQHLAFSYSWPDPRPVNILYIRTCGRLPDQSTSCIFYP